MQEAQAKAQGGVRDTQRTSTTAKSRKSERVPPRADEDLSAQDVEDAAQETDNMIGRLEQIFAKCDRKNIGKVSKIDLIQTLKSAPDVAEFFRLPQQIRQEDGSRDLFESIFQKINTSGNRLMGWPEFERYFAKEVAEAPRIRRTVVNQTRRKSSIVQ